MKHVLAFLTAALALPQAPSTTYTQCQAADQIHKNGLDSLSGATLGDWICLTKYESSWNTNVIGPMNSDGTYDYGFFQINDYYWCYSSGQPKYNDCNIDCSKLIDNSLTDDSKCAKTIYNRHGYSAWYGWINHCKGKDNSHYASECGY